MLITSFCLIVYVCVYAWDDTRMHRWPSRWFRRKRHCFTWVLEHPNLIVLVIKAIPLSVYTKTQFRFFIFLKFVQILVSEFCQFITKAWNRKVNGLFIKGHQSHSSVLLILWTSLIRVFPLNLPLIFAYIIIRDNLCHCTFRL